MDSLQKTTTSDSNLTKDLQQLTREFTALNAFYARFCDALADVLVEGRALDACTVEGLGRCSRWLKCCLDEIRVKLEVIQKESCKVKGSEPGF